MSLRVHLLALALVAVACALVGYKVLALGYSLSPLPSDDRWSVQVTVRAQARAERARLKLALPSGGAVAQVYDERFGSPGMTLAVRTKAGLRTATFTRDAGAGDAPLEVSYRFSARLPHTGSEAASDPAGKTGPDDLAATELVPSAEPQIVAKAQELTAQAADETAKVRALYDFVVDEIDGDKDPARPLPADLAQQALAQRKGGPTARVRLFVALCRAAGVAARPVQEVALAEGVSRPLLLRAEALAEGHWIAVDPVKGRFGPDAEEGFALVHGESEVVRAEGLDDVRVEVAVTREGVNEVELYQRRAAGGQSLLDRLSFYALPPPSQLAFRILLLVPLGALIVALFRNLVGTPTFGTFTPILIALSLRETRPWAGAAMLAIVVSVGFLGRKLLERMRLLVVPRLALLLTLVIFLMAAVALVSAHVGALSGLSVALLPMVIMTTTVERLSVTIAEEGTKSALRSLGGTLLVAGVGYVTLQSDALQRLAFTFPELNLLVAAALLELGQYTGYRLSEVVRFRDLAREPAAEEAPEPKVAG